MDSSGPGKGQIAGFFERGREYRRRPPPSPKNAVSHDCFRSRSLLKKDYDPWSLFVC